MELIQPKRPKKAKHGKKTRKHGRDSLKCAKYKSEYRREKNKIRKIKKYLKKHFTDQVSQKRLKELQEIVKNR